jgi:hypothetical protein
MKAVAVLAAQLVGVAAGVEVRGLQPRLLADRHSNPRGRNEEGWNRGRYGVYHDLDNWRRYMSAAGFNELTHYLRYRYRDTVYRIAVAIDGSDKSSMTVDGVEQSDHAISPGRRSPGTSGRGHNPGARVGVTQRKALRWQGLHNLLISNTPSVAWRTYAPFNSG